MHSARPYIIGFVLSLLLTLGGGGLIWLHEASQHATLSHEAMAAGFIVLALLQFGAQLVFFLHLGRKKSLLNTGMFAFTLLIVAIVVAGTLWIMYELGHNTGAHEPYNVFEEENIFPNDHVTY